MWCNKLRGVFTVGINRAPTALSSAKPPCRRFRVSCMCTQDQQVSLGKGSYVTVDPDTREEKMTTPGEAKPKTNRPFIKDIFLGIFDQDMLVFPEALSEQRLGELNEKLKTVKYFMSEEVDATAIDRDAVVPEHILQRMKELGLFGLQVPKAYGGFGFNATEMARVMEVLAGESSIALTLAMHNAVCIKSILECGTEAQKAMYLPKMASGEYIAGFALTESKCGCDLGAVATLATQSEDGNSYSINGTKSIVTNGNIADIFITFARVETLDTLGEIVNQVTAFIVPREAGGIVCGESQDKIGARGAQTCSVQFNNTTVPADNILGNVGTGLSVAVKSTHNTRYLAGAWAAGMGKTLLDSAVEHTINRSQFGKKLHNYGLIQKKLVKSAVTLYVMESMAYMTAATIDTYQEPDVSIEAAIVKIYTATKLQECIDDCASIFGGQAFLKAFPYERYVRDSRLFSWLFEGTNEMMHLFISLSGFQHAGKGKQELIMKMRDPLNNLTTIWNETFLKMMDSRSNPRLTLHLHNYVHPNLSYCAEELEKVIMKFKYEIERYLAVFGDKIIDEQMLLERVSLIVIEIYAITCVLARSSRSKCIGLKNADEEVRLTEMFCSESVRRLNDWLAELETGKLCNGDQLRESIAENMFKEHGYQVETPLTRNW